MAEIKGLSAHNRPPEKVRDVFKKYQRYQASEVGSDPDIIDLQKLDPDEPPESIALDGWMSSKDLRRAFHEFVKGENASSAEPSGGFFEDIPIFTHRSVSGLRLIPSLFPPTVQKELLSRLFHRDLSDPRHQTNVHLHYNVTYPDSPKSRGDDDKEEKDEKEEEKEARSDDQQPRASFFQADPGLVLSPKDPEAHKPITIQNFLEKKLRWITLGGQYNWTTKEYPAGPPPAFPQDIARLLRAAFPETEPQAAIVNVYSAGDTLSMHRDVSEECDSGLISVSFGCDGLFVVSHDDGEGCEVIRLRSGDAIYMAGRSRFAWHGVPKVLPSTCPTWLQDWPGPDYEYWRGWMGGKRVNLNVRQMNDVDENGALEH
ncbi:hypothetical protein VTN96DRAFT_563 [Rasamsonia emersonii]